MKKLKLKYKHCIRYEYSINNIEMKRNPKYVRGRERNRGTNKKRVRDTSGDPIYRNKNFNKLKNNPVTPFSWNRRCKYATSIYKRIYARASMKEQISEYYENIASNP